MDAFYAAVEQRDAPELQGKPIAIGSASPRGVVATASYEARKFGVKSAMASSKAMRLCPQLIFVKPRFEAYKAVSAQLHEIFKEYTDLIEPLSLDEAYLDVTDNKKGMKSATYVAQAIKHDILERTQLTASAGVSFNKFLAKIASDVNKPNGLFVIEPHQAEAFIETLPIGRFYGIGKVTADRMERMGIFKGADLKRKSEADLFRLFGKAGRFYYRIVRGIDDRPVESERISKSVGVEETFRQDLEHETEWMEALGELSEDLSRRMKRHQKLAKTLTLKIKFSDFQQVTRSHTVSHFLQHKEEIFDLAVQLLQNPALPDAPIRLLGLSCSTLLTPANYQLWLDFSNEKE
jgi:DNA polymerase-4